MRFVANAVAVKYKAVRTQMREYLRRILRYSFVKGARLNLDSRSCEERRAKQ